MNARPSIEPWDAVSKRAYWDRDVPLEKWREKIFEGHRSYLPDAVSSMSAAEFIHYFGVDRFMRGWPALRADLPESAAKYAAMYDLAWSKLVADNWNLRPFADFYAMPAKRRQFLMQVAKSPGKSIYAVAKDLGMQYRRAHEHAVNLVRDGKIRSKEAVENGHRQLKLYPSYAQARKSSPAATVG